MSMKSPRASGFTIVELLIVVVVIGILAAIVVVAYNGVTGAANDAKRQSDLNSIAKALERYRIDNGGYPRCGAAPGGTGPNTTYALLSGTAESCLADDLIPTYMNAIPVDPRNDGAQYVYRYAVGYQKNGAASFTGNNTDNYILGTKHDTVSSPTYGGWGQSGLTMLIGSGN